MPLKIKIEPDALVDIQEAVDWYNSQRKAVIVRAVLSTHRDPKVWKERI